MHRLAVTLAALAVLPLAGCSGADDTEPDVQVNNVPVGTALVADDPAGDVTFERKQTVTDPVDIRRVEYTRMADDRLQVVIIADNVQGRARQVGRETYHADVYLGLERRYSIGADLRGRLSVLDLATGKVARPGGNVAVDPGAGTVTLLVPVSALGDLPSISVGASVAVVTVPNGDHIADDEAEFPLDQGV